MNKNSTISKLKKMSREDFIYNVKMVAGAVVGAACLYGMMWLGCFLDYCAGV